MIPTDQIKNAKYNTIHGTQTEHRESDKWGILRWNEREVRGVMVRVTRIVVIDIYEVNTDAISIKK